MPFVILYILSNYLICNYVHAEQLPDSYCKQISSASKIINREELIGEYMQMFGLEMALIYFDPLKLNPLKLKNIDKS